MQTVQLSSVALSPKEQNRSPPDPHHLGVPQVLLKWFMNLRYVWRKPSTYLAPTLTLFQNRSKQDSTWPTKPRSSIGCLQYYFWAYGTFDKNQAPILHQEKHYPQTDRTELPLVPRHIGVCSSSSKMISIPTVCSVQTVLQPCIDTNTISKWTKRRFHTTHITYKFHRVRPKLFMTYGTFNANRAPIYCSAISKRTKQISTRPRSPRSTVGASETIYEPVVRWTQTEHLSCTDANIVSKQIKTRFHMTHVT
jgi:hypothetical protein